RIVIWRSPHRDSSGQVDATVYRDAGRSYGPRFGSFRSIGELRLVIGMSDVVQTAVAPFITVWSETGIVDRSVAKEGLLRMLAADNDNLAAAQLAARQAGRAAGADRPVALGETLTIRASVEISGVSVTRGASIQIAGDRNEPYRVLTWR